MQRMKRWILILDLLQITLDINKSQLTTQFSRSRHLSEFWTFFRILDIVSEFWFIVSLSVWPSSWQTNGWINETDYEYERLSQWAHVLSLLQASASGSWSLDGDNAKGPWNTEGHTGASLFSGEQSLLSQELCQWCTAQRALTVSQSHSAGGGASL